MIVFSRCIGKKEPGYLSRPILMIERKMASDVYYYVMSFPMDLLIVVDLYARSRLFKIKVNLFIDLLSIMFFPRFLSTQSQIEIAVKNYN